MVLGTIQRRNKLTDLIKKAKENTSETLKEAFAKWFENKDKQKVLKNGEIKLKNY